MIILLTRVDSGFHTRMRNFIVITFSSEVIFKKQRKASENCSPHGPLLKSAMQGHSNAFWAFTSRDWKIPGSTSLVVISKKKKKITLNTKSKLTSFSSSPYAAASVKAHS